LRAAYLLQLPGLEIVHGWTVARPVPVLERSFLLTAAGQFRSLTGFPFQVNLRFTTESRIDYIVSLEPGQHLYVVVCVEIVTKVMWYERLAIL